MIHTSRTVTVGKMESIINEPIVLYRGDREVEVEFVLNGSKFMFTNGGNVIKSTNATLGQLVVNTPTGENMFSEITECHDGKVVFVITKEMIDELVEVGFYSFQIRLFDDTQVSRVTIPPVHQGIDIRNPIAAEDETDLVDIGLVDYSVVRKDDYENVVTFLPNGDYNKTLWEEHDVISRDRLNKVEDALYEINKSTENLYPTLQNQYDEFSAEINNDVKAYKEEMEDEVEQFERDMTQAFGEFKVDYKDEVHDRLDDVEGELAHIENEIDVNGVKVHFPQRALNESDCIIIETKENVSVIDVGWETNSTNLVNYLKTKGINKIDNIIISHYHEDHIGGTNGEGFNSFINSSLDFSNCVCYLPHRDIDYTKIVDNVGNGISNRIKTAQTSVEKYLNTKGITIKYADEGEILKLNNLTNIKLMNVSSIYLDEYYNQTLNNNDVEQGYTCYNNFSLVCELTHLKNKFLFSGDIELKAQELLLNNLNNNYDVYKVEHHGVNKSTYKDYLYKINPKIAVVQNRSSLGLKGKMTTTYLYNKGCKIYDNTNCGDIIVKSNGVNVYVDSITESKIDIGFSYCAQPYDLKRGIAINKNDDLNKFTDLGIYYSESSTITSSLQNKPDNISNGGFKLIVQARQTDTSPIQIIIDSNASLFIRSYSNNYNKWKEIPTEPNSYINCRLSTSHTTTSTTAEKLNIETVSSRGDNLKVEDGCVVIGPGINAIKVTGQIGWSSDATGNNVLEGYVYKNNTSIIRNGITSISTYFGVPLSSKIIDVQEGDKISLYARSRTKEGFTVSNGSDNTWLCVEVV